MVLERPNGRAGPPEELSVRRTVLLVLAVLALLTGCSAVERVCSEGASSEPGVWRRTARAKCGYSLRW